LEYLFAGEHPALPGEFEQAVEFGFRTAPDLAALVGLYRNPLLLWNFFFCGRMRKCLLYQTSHILICMLRCKCASMTSTFFQGLDAAVLLSNNVGMADHLRIQAALELSAAETHGGASHLGSAGTLPWLMDAASGRLMVAKVYLGRTVAETTHVGSK
jgi:hypothetical protein